MLLADAGYDCEENHRYPREELGIDTMIAPFNGGAWRRAKTPFRKQMKRLFKKRFPRVFGKRWHVETVFSMIKRNLGSALSGRNYWSHCRQMWLKAINHNIMIVAEL